ncbi:unnamed protein product [Meganyctiphanes norvegica]|uniref:Uncharacterized protein n=1 Tax=Meganyctiphanes norvegica TaxID=48144 RepID=A0AAV2QK90_MEGNR
MLLLGTVSWLVLLGLSAWSEGAPQGLEQQSSSVTSPIMSRDTRNDIMPILPAALTRRKRGSASTRPYSNYRPRTMGSLTPYSGIPHVSRVRRYRYPVYRKRSSSQVPTYDYDDYEGNYPVDLEDLLKSRNEKKYLPSSYLAPLVKKDSVYNLANSPYDLQTMGRLYEVGKRNSQIPIDVYDLKTMGQLYEVGKRSPSIPLDAYDLKTMGQLYEVGKRSHSGPLDAKEFYNAIDAVRRKKNALETEHSAAEDSMIRRKRDMPLDRVGPPNKLAHGNNVDTNATADPTTSKDDVPNSPLTGHEGSWVRQKKSAKDDNLNELLTRKYFQNFAQSVGDKKKRTAYAQISADKRSPGIEEMLSNPSMLKYMQDQLKAAQ